MARYYITSVAYDKAYKTDDELTAKHYSQDPDYYVVDTHTDKTVYDGDMEAGEIQDAPQPWEQE